MNLHQFRFVQEAVRQKLNLTETAKVLFTSQPGISKAILELEDELGVDIFARHGKRLRRVTEPGAQVLKSIEIIMREVGNLKRIGEEFSKQDAGTLSIATTHTQARYFLPEPVAQLRGRFPKVQVVLHQAALGSVPRSLADPITTNAANVTGFLNMLVAARDAQVQSFTYAASSSTYGDHPALPKVEELYIEGYLEAQARGGQENWSYGFAAIKTYLGFPGGSMP